MRQIVLFLIISFLYACSDDTFERDSSDQAIIPEGKVSLSVNLISGGFNKPVKSSMTESTLTNVWALCFENPNPDIYDPNAVLSEIVPVELNGVIGKMILSASETPAFILFIANADKIIQAQRNNMIGKPYQSILTNDLLYGSSASDGITALSNPEKNVPFLDNTTYALNTSIPMFGESTIIPKIQKGIKISSVLLTRSVSKLNVDATKAASASGFTLTGISLVNVFSKGLINPKGMQMPPLNKSTRVNYGKLVNNVLQPILDRVENNSTNAYPLYFFRTQQPIEVIIRGRSKNSTSDRFYKVLIKEDAALCNVSYLLNILSVSNNGYATMQEAITSPAGSGIVVDVLVLDDSHDIIANQDYFLGLTSSQFMLFADGEQKNITVATVTTNAFNTGNTSPQTQIELITGENMSLVAGQQISSNSTDIKVNFTADQTAQGKIRITIGTLVKDITVRKDWAIAGNFNNGKNGVFIADNVIEIHPTIPNGRLAFASAETSPERSSEIASLAGSPIYAFVKSVTGPDNIEFRALTKSGETILVRNITDIPEFGGNNIYWDTQKRNLKFDNYETAANDNTQNIIGLQGYGWGNMVLGRAASEPIHVSAFTVVPNNDQTITTIHAVKENTLPNQTYADTNNGYLTMDPDNNMGDICIFMSRRNLAPVNKSGTTKWKLPNLTDISNLPKRVSFSADWNKTPTNPTDPNGLSKTAYAEYGELFYFPLTWNVQNFPFLQNKLYTKGFKYPMDRRNESAFQFFLSQSRFQYPGSYYDTNSTLGYSVRCVADNSQGENVPLYKISYNWEKAENAGEIMTPSDYTGLKSKFVEAGGNVTLSSTKFNAKDLNHTGWIADGKIYPFGATITNIHQDMVFEPYIRNPIFADSNIYWDGKQLTFDYDPANSSPTKETKQGVFFKFGSLVGVGPNGSVLSDPGMLISDIPCLSIIFSTNQGEEENSLVLHHDPAKKVGDICKYLSDKGLVPKGEWRVPTAAEYRLLSRNRKEITPWEKLTNVQADGQTLISWGYLYLNKTLLPPSGYIHTGNTAASAMGSWGYYWTSTASGRPTSPYMCRIEITYPVQSNTEGINQQTLLPIRCVK